MINVKIIMTNGFEYNIRNIADNIKDFYKRVMAPYGTNMVFVEIIKGELINTENIVSIREMTEDEVNSIDDVEEDDVEEDDVEEEVVGLTDTDIETLESIESESKQPEDAQ